MEAESVKMLPGGSALNQGRHLHALGTRVRFFGAVRASSAIIKARAVMKHQARTFAYHPL